MLFKPGTPLYAYEVVREADRQVMYINYLGSNSVPDLAGDEDLMSRIVDLLVETPNITRIVFVQQRNYCYDAREIFLLQEIANLHTYLTKQEKILSPTKLSIMNTQYLSQRHNDMNYLLMLLKRDPIACFYELNRFLKKEVANMEVTPEDLKIDQQSYVRLLEKFKNLLEKTRLIKIITSRLQQYTFGKRDIYYQTFRADIIPNFTFTRLVASLPEEAEIVDQYEIGEEATVTILKRKEDAKYFYHLMPPEYTLAEDKQELLNLARNVLIEHQPKAEEFTDPEKTRQVFYNVSRDLIRDLSESKRVKIDYDELNKLARILVRHTIGFGLIEVLWRI
jgi:hypothetical protein